MTDQLLANTVESARKLLDRQRKRGLFFANNVIFGDPAWELLLALYIETEQHDCVKKGDLYEGLSVSTSIASRWLTVFLDQGYIEICENRGPDFVRLTQDAQTECTDYLNSMRE
ncbi:hypothetical protein [Parasphingorhabdus cellanae]|uniref:MarR family transcriptional regulator n=1 Tax=Parasphingorhabdus cellanae TaxID=2806553 RepID=A0ABX7T4K2_9SPHN|nr:hypothetical protein [Parasphingorhabdus cellanae]QTD55424.1 hypothetical protein J4G78_14615 [Parasphingorhabdus cellanae]